MKIEKVNDNQIRCTLTKEDLAKRQLKISELAYGTEKAKSLFKDMMEQASFEFGFEAEDIPLMIEAIPMSSECIVLIITKVENPEELDTRFSKFMPQINNSSEDPDDDDVEIDDKDDLYDLFQRIQNFSPESFKGKVDTSDEVFNEARLSTEAVESILERKIEHYAYYTTPSLNTVIRIAHLVADMYTGLNSLYKDTRHNQYILAVSNIGCESKELNQLGCLLIEYCEALRFPPLKCPDLAEHHKLLIRDNAFQVLAQL